MSFLGILLVPFSSFCKYLTPKKGQYINWVAVDVLNRKWPKSEISQIQRTESSTYFVDPQFPLSSHLVRGGRSDSRSVSFYKMSAPHSWHLMAPVKTLRPSSHIWYQEQSYICIIYYRWDGVAQMSDTWNPGTRQRETFNQCSAHAVSSFHTNFAFYILYFSRKI